MKRKPLDKLSGWTETRGRDQEEPKTAVPLDIKEKSPNALEEAISRLHEAEA
jgi:hypothetical protein